MRRSHTKEGELAPQTRQAGALTALLVAAMAAAPGALAQPSPDPAPATPTLTPDPAPAAAPAPPVPTESSPQPVTPAAPAPATSAPAVEQPEPAPPEEPTRSESPAKPKPRTEPREQPDATRGAEPSLTRAAFLRVESLLPRVEGSDDGSNTHLLLAAGALLMLVLASGSLVSVLARLLPPTAVLVVLLAAPAQAGEISADCYTSSSADQCTRWYTAQQVSLVWTVQPGSGEVPNASGCDQRLFSAEMSRTWIRCEVSWNGGPPDAKNVWIGIDRTPPRITGLQTSRPPDHGGWFNHPVSLTFKAWDATSGVDRCTSMTYSGPGAVGGTCTDVAGNTASGSVPLKYDATAPPEPSATARPGNRRVRVEWTPAPNAKAEVTRRRGGRAVVVYSGAADAFVDRGLRNGKRYRYTVALVDQAGNRAADGASAVPTSSPLLTPAAGARLASPPLLAWREVRRARYYNVQVLRGRRKVLSRWPKANQLQLTRRWRFAGKARRLGPGRYCYVVWPGVGPRSQRDYGQLLGKRCFRITA